MVTPTAPLADTVLSRRVRPWIALVALALGTSACADDPSGPSEPQHTHVRAVPHRDLTPRFSLQLQIGGPLRPGMPLEVTTRANAHLSSKNVVLRVLVLDEAPGDHPDAPQGVRTLAEWRGNLERGASESMLRTVSFSRPGYYRIAAAVSGSDPADLSPDSVVNAAFQTLYVYIDESGGRITDGYDPSVVGPDRVPYYFSYGPFRPKGANGLGATNPQHSQVGVVASSVAVSSRAATGMAAVRLAASSTDTYVEGYYEYVDESTDYSHPPVTRLPNARIDAMCWGYSSQMKMLEGVADTAVAIYSTTNQNGYFFLNCPEDPTVYQWAYIEGSIFPQRRGDVRVLTATGGQTYTSFHNLNESTITVRASTNRRGQVYWVLQQYIPNAEARFGRSRSSVDAWVWESFGGSSKYEKDEDRIEMRNTDRIFNADGYFVILHEYGHAFHYRAIEAFPTSGNCDPHGWETSADLRCAFYEGFADFFATWMGESFFWSGGHLHDWNMEEHPVWHDVEAPIREGAVAGFFYDLVDGPNSPNGNSNEIDGLDDDGVEYSASVIADIIASCDTNAMSQIDRKSVV